MKYEKREKFYAIFNILNRNKSEIKEGETILIFFEHSYEIISLY